MAFEPVEVFVRAHFDTMSAAEEEVKAQKPRRPRKPKAQPKGELRLPTRPGIPVGDLAKGKFANDISQILWQDVSLRVARRELGFLKAFVGIDDKTLVLFNGLFARPAAAKAWLKQDAKHRLVSAQKPIEAGRVKKVLFGDELSKQVRFDDTSYLKGTEAFQSGADVGDFKLSDNTVKLIREADMAYFGLGLSGSTKPDGFFKYQNNYFSPGRTSVAIEMAARLISLGCEPDKEQTFMLVVRPVQNAEDLIVQQLRTIATKLAPSSIFVFSVILKSGASRKRTKKELEQKIGSADKRVGVMNAYVFFINRPTWEGATKESIQEYVLKTLRQNKLDKFCKRAVDANGVKQIEYNVVVY
jgi:hypothetical protein